jgi:hypothetical protein
MGERDAVGVPESQKWEYHSEDEEELGEDTVCFISTRLRVGDCENINYL